MPRDGTQTYVLPFPDVVADTTIESPVYNGFTNDIAQDLNWPRPITSGGTGATSAAGALANLGGETAGQVVTNYDGFVFKAGSFYSAAGATAAPTANAFSGICYQSDASNMVVEARDSSDGKLYIRRKVAGVWTSWTLDFDQTAQNTLNDARFVNVAGDTMTGTLQLTAPTDLAMHLKLTAANGQNKYMRVVNSGDMQWVNNANSAVIMTLNDGGGLSVNSLAAAGGNVSTTNAVVTGAAGTTGTYYFGSSGTKYLQFDGASTFNFVGGSVATLNGSLRSYLPSGGLHLQLTETTGSWSKYLRVINGGNLEVVNSANSGVIMTLTDVGMLICNSANIQSVATSTVTAGTSVTVGSTVLGPVSVELGPTTGGAVQSYIDFHCGFASDFEARIIATGSSAGVGTLAYTATSHTFNNIISCASTIESTGHRCRQGLSGGFNSNYYNLFYNAGPMQLWADATNLGNISVISDYRTKKDVAALPSTWNAVKALRPIKYTQKDFSPPSHKGDDPFIRGDNNERWGFMAHELQETLVMEAATGAKDAADAIQSPNPMIVIAALTKALQEAMTRIEALEAR